MTRRERVFASIRRQPLDALPWQFDLTSFLEERLKAYYGTDDVLEATGDHIVKTGDMFPGGQAARSVGPRLVADEFGAVWRREARDLSVGNWGELHFSPLKEPSLKGYGFPDGAKPGRWSGIRAIRRRYPDHFLMAIGAGLFEQGWAICGFENYLSHMGSDPAFIEELTERLADFSCATTGQLKGLGVDGIRFGDDWGVQTGLLISPATWRRLYKNAYRRIYAAARDIGLVVAIHSCGNITDILPDLIEIGVDVVHPLQPEAMDVAFCQREFGKNLTFWGGLGSQSTIPNGTAGENRREARQRLDLFRNGGYILAPAGAAPTETPVENIVAIVETAKEQLKTQGRA
jgi:uroporphyrinogen decarboxylase